MADHEERESRYQPLAAAVLFAVSLSAGLALNTPPDFNAADARWTAFWNVRSHRVSEILAGYALLVAGGALIWFAAQIERRVGSRTVYAAGWGAAGMIWVSSILLAAVPVAKSISGAPSPSADIARITTDMGAAALGMVAAPIMGFLILAACLAARRSHALDRRVVWAGYVLAILGGVGGAAMMPMFFLPLWVLLAGATLAFRRDRTAVPAAAAAV
jgi:hypothetical protein